MNDITCPYCGYEEEVCHDDGYGYEEDRKHQQQCGNCEKYYVFTTCISFDYDATKADCLNGQPHMWKHTHTHPIEYTNMKCVYCDEKRAPTSEEMTLIVKDRQDKGNKD